MDAGTERWLLSAARSGDMDAYGQLYRETHTKIQRAACRLVGVQEADDVVQETYMQALKGLGAFRGECRLTTWLYRILLNRIAASRRRKCNQSIVPLDPETCAFSVCDPHVRLDLERGLKMLRVADRELVYRALEGYKVAEIASQVEPAASVCAVVARRRRARLAMTRALVGRGKDAGIRTAAGSASSPLKMARR